MDPIYRLLQQIRRKQILLCAYRASEADTNSPSTLTDITSVLRISAGDCLKLAHRLQAKKLLQPVPGYPAGYVQLTNKGQRLVQRMLRDVTPPAPVHTDPLWVRYTTQSVSTRGMQRGTGQGQPVERSLKTCGYGSLVSTQV